MDVEIRRRDDDEVKGVRVFWIESEHDLLVVGHVGFLDPRAKMRLHFMGDGTQIERAHRLLHDDPARRVASFLTLMPALMPSGLTEAAIEHLEDAAGDGHDAGHDGDVDAKRSAHDAVRVVGSAPRQSRTASTITTPASMLPHRALSVTTDGSAFTPTLGRTAITVHTKANTVPIQSQVPPSNRLRR